MAKRVMDMAEADRPREKLVRLGAAALRDDELMAVLLGSGNAQMDVMTMSREFVKHIDGKGLDIKLGDLIMPGVGEAKAAKVLAALEFARRRIKPAGVKILETKDVLPLIQHFAFQRQEHVLCVTVNGANEVINTHTVAVGAMDNVSFDPREVFSRAVAEKASGIILAHNHPEGDLKPSDADREMTFRIQKAGEIVGILLLDHIIFSRNDYFSFAEHGAI